MQQGREDSDRNNGGRSVKDGAGKWRGSVRKTVEAPLQKVWEIGADFEGLKKWLPHMDTCNLVEGENWVPGCIRYCRGNGNNLPAPHNRPTWAKERLVSLDHDNHLCSYSMIEGSLGIDGYVACFQVQDAGNGSAVVDWSFEANPASNFTEEQFIRSIGSALERMIQRLEEAAVRAI